MISELITYLMDTAKQHVLIGSVAYKEVYNINDQNNEKQFQFIIDSSNMIEKNITENVIKCRLEIYCLGFVKYNNNILDVQDQATHMLIDFINYIDNDSYPVEVYDWSLLSLSEYSDNNSSGVKLSLDVIIPNILNLCEYKNNFIEKTEEEIPSLEISNGDECTNTKYNNESNLILNPIKLK